MGVLIFCALEWGFGLQDPAIDKGLALTNLLENARPQDVRWRMSVFRSLRDLELGGHADLEKGWAILAESGADSDLANQLLFRRRQGIPLGDVHIQEAEECALERALAFWGDMEWSATGEVFSRAVAQWPDDLRFSRNRRWLTRTAPPILDLSAEPREAAWAVLAARLPQD